MNNLEYFIHQLEQEKTFAVDVPREALLSCLDLTSLNMQDDEKAMELLCKKALQYRPAAVCVYPGFVSYVSERLKRSSVKVATVANFPEGTLPLPEVCFSIEKALKNGAVEIDVVIPYQNFLVTQNASVLKDFVRACKSLLPNKILKVILESGAFHNTALLEKAALACLEAGADFLKTSTGKIAQGATPTSAVVLLQAIQQVGDKQRGFKASGGIRHYDQAKMYYLLAKKMMGETWLSPKTFRLGASSLLDELT